jgi:exopolysaccharide biosynthesis polyprenyl glycosylphosphotransferase
VSTASLNRVRQRNQTTEWARLIPGEIPGERKPGKKRPSSVRQSPESLTGWGVAEQISNSESALGLLVPRPLQDRIGLRWLWSMAADFSFIALSWLLVGGLLSLLRGLPREMRWLDADGIAGVSLIGLSILHAALITLVGYSEGLQLENTSLQKQGRILGKSVLWATMVLCLGNGLQGAGWSTHALFCSAGLVGFGALWSWRWWWAGANRTERRTSGRRNVLIVGAGPVGRSVAGYLREHPTERNLCGFLDDDWPVADEVVGRVAELSRVAREKFVDEIILAAPRSSNVSRRVIEEARQLRLDVEIVPDLLGCRPVASDIERLGGLPLICVHVERLPAAGLALKRLVDVAGASIAMVVLCPLLAALAFLVKVDSEGSVLYGAKRAGRKGRVFRCYKFRTMVSNADELKEQLRKQNVREGPFFKLTDDPRITRVGKFLRRYSLDELPQLWNVLMGDMSLVGPRPHPLDDVAEYEIGHLGRLDVTPGITGLWQVTARRDPSFRRGMELDREYIRRWSLGLDLRILLRTVLEVACGSGE